MKAYDLIKPDDSDDLIKPDELIMKLDDWLKQDDLIELDDFCFSY
jgi:hypothetical protein